MARCQATKFNATTKRLPWAQINQVRAKLSLITSSIDKRKANKRLKLASVIELLHTATLVHDDVVDSSQTRRGAASVNNIWTNSHSVLIGDYIYSKALC